MTGGAGCDNLTVGLRCPGQSNVEYRSEFSIWVIAGGQLLVSTDVRNMSALQREVLLNAEALAVFNDPLAALGSRIHNNMFAKTSVWARHLHDRCVAVALLNAGESTQTLHVELAEIPGAGWHDLTTVSVRDLWAHASLPAARGRVAATVGPHATFLAKLCAV
jgi:alpha-galactosidase